MPLSPYANCPCGSGKQFKWCCQPYFGFVEKAILQEEKGQHGAADQTLDQLIQKFPQVPQAWGYCAEFLLTNGRADEAESAIQKAMDLDPNFAFGFWLRGLMRLNEGESQGALTLFRKTADLLHPNANDLQSQVHARIAELEMAFNRPVAARAAADFACTSRPQLQELRGGCGQSFRRSSGPPESARRAYSLRSPPETWTDSGRPKGKQGDHLKAEPREPAAWFNLRLSLTPGLEAISRVFGALLTVHCIWNRRATCSGDGGFVRSATLWPRARTARRLCAATRSHGKLRDAEVFSKLLSEWLGFHRLVVLHTDEKEHVLSGLILESTPDLGSAAGTPLARLQSYLLIDRADVRLWASSRSRLDEVVAEDAARPVMG